MRPFSLVRLVLSRCGRLALIVALILTSAHCATRRAGELPLGMLPERTSYIPARIAIFPCRLWPKTSPFTQLKSQDLPAAEVVQLCTQVDEYMLKGFEGQPYMKGISPKTVGKSYEKAPNISPTGSADANPTINRSLDSAYAQWIPDPADPMNIIAAQTFYVNAIAPRQGWRLWLADFSSSVRSSDAILLPLVINAGLRDVNERGLTRRVRHTDLILLLIDTSTGQLLWSGGRAAEVSTSQLNGKKTVLPPPPWDELYPRLLTNDLWREFPGRQLN